MDSDSTQLAGSLTMAMLRLMAFEIKNYYTRPRFLVRVAANCAHEVEQKKILAVPGVLTRLAATE